MTRLYDHIFVQTWPGDPPVMDCSKVATGSSFGVLDPVKEITASVKRWYLNQGQQNSVCKQSVLHRMDCDYSQGNGI